MSDKTRLLNDTIADAVADFLYYDRLQDPNLPVGSIQEMVKTEAVSFAYIAEKFRAELKRGLGQ